MFPCMVALKLFLAFFGGKSFDGFESTQSLSRYLMAFPSYSEDLGSTLSALRTSVAVQYTHLSYSNCDEIKLDALTIARPDH